MDVSYLAAAGGGLLSFLSPCVLPIVPAYLCFIAGTSFEELTVKTDRPEGLAWRIAGMALVFVFGFATVFVALGASASAVNRLIVSNLDVFAQIAGVVIIVFGLHFMGLLRIPFLNREARFQTRARPAGFVGSYVAGIAFGFGWTPCIGPILASILAIAASREQLGYGVGLLATYALGLGIPFLLAAVAINPFLRFLGRIRRHLHKVEIAAGVLLVITGLMIMTGRLQVLAYWILEMFPALATLG